jgi:uncharacterized protein YcfL
MAKFNFRAPRYAQLPHLETMLNSIGSDQAVADLLGLTLATIKRYRKEGQAPRSVMYALFWETPWGISVADCQATNEARLAYMKAKALERENITLKAQIAKLEELLAEGRNYAANEHFFRVGGL